MIWRTNGLADHDIRKTGNTADITAVDMVDFGTIKSMIREELRDLEVRGGLIQTDAGDRITEVNLTAIDTSDSDTSDITVVVEKGRLELKRSISVGFRSRNGLDDGIENRITTILLAF